MFTGIIENLGIVKSLNWDNTNLHIEMKSSISKELKVDQSVSHNGVCLTVVKRDNDCYTVTAIKETLEKTNLNSLSIGSIVNIELVLSRILRREEQLEHDLSLID